MMPILLLEEQPHLLAHAIQMLHSVIEELLDIIREHPLHLLKKLLLLKMVKLNRSDGFNAEVNHALRETELEMLLHMEITAELVGLLKDLEQTKVKLLLSKGRALRMLPSVIEELPVPLKEPTSHPKTFQNHSYKKCFNSTQRVILFQRRLGLIAQIRFI